MKLYNEVELTEIAEMDLTEPCYDFHLITVWKDSEGKHYWAADSGCSCPEPYEDFTKIEDFNLLVTSYDFDKMTEEANTGYSVELTAGFLNTVRDSMRQNVELEFVMWLYSDANV